MTKKHELIALVDMDGTLCDYAGAMERDLARLRHPDEPDSDENAPHLVARRVMIRRQPGWWLGLERHEDGFRILEVLKDYGFTINILTKGPWDTSAAWAEKMEWCRTHIGRDVKVTVTEDKGLVYGKVLVDDWPPYIERWLEWQPGGMVVMPDRPWNQGFTHPNVFRYSSTGLQSDMMHKLGQALSAITG